MMDLLFALTQLVADSFEKGKNADFGFGSQTNEKGQLEWELEITAGASGCQSGIFRGTDLRKVLEQAVEHFKTALK